MGKAYGIKVWCYWEHLEGSIGNLMGTYWGQPKNLNPNLLKKKPLKRRRLGYSIKCMSLCLLICGIENYGPKIVCHHFWLGLIPPLPNNLGTSCKTYLKKNTYHTTWAALA